MYQQVSDLGGFVEVDALASRVGNMNSKRLPGHCFTCSCSLRFLGWMSPQQGSGEGAPSFSLQPRVAAWVPALSARFPKAPLQLKQD